MGVETPEEWATALWRRLEGAPRRRGDGFRTPMLATVDSRGEPELRTIVLRRASEEERLLEFHTDTASEKWTSLEKAAVVEVGFWDSRSRTQVRLRGTAERIEGEEAQVIYRGLGSRTRQTYCQAPPPGTPLTNSSDFRLDGLPRFGVIRVQVHRMDALKLSKPRHQRIRMDWVENTWSGGWVSP